MEKIGENEAYQRFDDFLDELHNEGQGIDIGGIAYTYSRVLRTIDEIRYEEEFNNWMDSEDLELE